MFGVEFIILEIFCFLFFAFVFILVMLQIFSRKFRSKMMGKQIKALKDMVEDSKEDIESISTNMANANKEGVEITSRAIKKGFTDEDAYCKHCGCKIDKNSRFCKSCGKEQ